MVKIISLIALFALSTACIKTADQVEREKRIESMNEQMKDSQTLVADLLAQNKSMQTQLNKLNGRLEELEHRQKQVNPENIHRMNETLNVMKSKQDTDSAQLVQIQNEIKEQRAFLEKVTQSLASAKEAPKAGKKKSAKADLEEGLEYIKHDTYADARTTLEALIDHPDLTPGEKNKVLYGLGKTEYYSGNSDKALVYFSKIYTKFPKASLAPSSLLFIGRSLAKLGKKDEAKEAFLKVIEDYKGSKEANEAKKEL
jgi:TolA-binding protein